MYMRIAPSASLLMKLHNIKRENLDLPKNLKTLSREIIINFINKTKTDFSRLTHGHSIHREMAIEPETKSTTSTSTSNINSQSTKTTSKTSTSTLGEDIANSSNLNDRLVEFKNTFPQHYLSSRCDVTNLVNYINAINTNHKKSVIIDDFIAKVHNYNYIIRLALN